VTGTLNAAGRLDGVVAVVDVVVLLFIGALTVIVPV
jgi:hypothetical protein